MTKRFGITILLAIVLGLVFPYAALSVSEYGFVFLFFLMFLSGFSLKWSRLLICFKRPRELLFGLALVFIFVPLIQWNLASLLITNEKFLLGYLFAALMPVAIVAPFFTELADGDTELSYALMMVSTLLTPVLAPLLLYLFAGSSIPIRIGPLMLSIGMFVILPLLASLIVSLYMTRLEKLIKKNLSLLNALGLGALIFILFGSVVTKVNTHYVSEELLLKLLFLAFFQDFGIYFLVRLLMSPFVNAKVLRTLAIGLSMKNVAISAGIMLFYDPQAALPSALVFVAHALLFSVIVFLDRWMERKFN